MLQGSALCAARPTREQGDDKHTRIGRDFRRSLAQAPAPSRINCKISSWLLKTLTCQVSKASGDGAWPTSLVLAVPIKQVSPCIQPDSPVSACVHWHLTLAILQSCSTEGVINQFHAVTQKNPQKLWQRQT